MICPALKSLESGITKIMPIIKALFANLTKGLACVTWFMTTAGVMGCAIPSLRVSGRHQPIMSNPTAAKKTTQLRLLDSTRTLFVFRRDDGTPEQVTRVRIRANVQARHNISPLIFGNFIEHLGGVIYEGLWAQAVLNPSLERIENETEAPEHWKVRHAARWIESGYDSPRAVRLSLNATDSTDKANEADEAELAQTVHLPAHRILGYTLHLAARAPQGSGQAVAMLRGIEGANQGKILAQTSVVCENTDWQPKSSHLELSIGQVKRGEPVELVIAWKSGIVEVDHVELWPNDAVEGLDPDVLKRARAWQMPIVRYPGGNFVSGYNWEDGVGPAWKRPTGRNPAWGGVESNQFGTDEFLGRFCPLTQTLPQITVNAGDGTPENAAAWVRYCNSSSSSDKWGQRRAANGHAAPYNVKLWEIGNELYGGWQIGHTDLRGNAARYVRFRDAMLQADPTIRLIATGKGEEFNTEGRERDRLWNEALLRAALADGGRTPDYLSIHPLLPLPGILPDASYAERYESAMAHPTFLGDTFLPELATTIASVEGAGAKTQIAITEWGIIIGGDRWWEGPNHDVQAGAIYNALTLNAMIRNSDHVGLANMTAFMHGGGIKKPNGVVIVDPQYYTQQLYASARPHIPLETVAVGPGMDVPARGALPAIPNVPDMDVVATLSQDGKALTVFAVNRQEKKVRGLSLDVQGFAPASLSATLLSAPDPQTRNTLETPDAVKPRAFPVPPWTTTTRKDWHVDLPPCSLMVLTFTRRKA